MIYLIDITNIYKICKNLAKKIKFLCNPIGCEVQEGAE